MSTNIWNAPGSTPKYIHLANNTHSYLSTALGRNQLAIETDKGSLSYKDNDSVYISLDERYKGVRIETTTPAPVDGVIIPYVLSSDIDGSGAIPFIRLLYPDGTSKGQCIPVTYLPE